MANSPDQVRRALDRIASCNNSKELRNIADNARRLRHAEVESAALRKLYAVRPHAEPGTLEHAVWQSIFALEDALKEERGKTILLSRTRQKIARDGEVVTVADLVRKAPSDGYKMLIERGWPELTFEAIALHHPTRFDASVLEAAKDRLASSGVALTAVNGSKS